MSHAPHTRQVADIAELLIWTAMQHPPTLAGSRLLCVDGAGGSGKTTLAEAMASVGAQDGSVALVHMDDIYQGWDGLQDAVRRVGSDLVAPLAIGAVGHFQRYDWHSGKLAEWHSVEPVDLLIIEGVGSGSVAADNMITTLVWVEAPRALRLARGVARDGEELQPQWLTWMDQEHQLFTQQRTRARAHIIVDGTGEADNAVTFL